MSEARTARWALLAGFAGAAALRLYLLFSYPGGYDTESYAIVAQIEARHGNVYAETTRYNYSPVWGWMLLAFDRAGRTLGLELLRAVGLFLFAVDGVTAYLVARLAASRHSPPAAWRPAAAGLLFFANPVSVLISSWHLQFDALSILFLLLALRSAENPGPPRVRTRSKRPVPLRVRTGVERPVPSRVRTRSERPVPLRVRTGAERPVALRVRTAAALSASLLVKHITWFHPLLFARRERPRNWLWAFAPYAVFLLSFLPYAGSWREIRQNVFRYRSLSGNYGTEALLLIHGVPEWIPSALFAGALVCAIVFLPRADLARAALRLFLVVLVFLPGFSRQYCVWPIALGSLFPGPGLLVYTAVSAAFLTRGFYGFDQAPSWLPGWYGPWWAAVLWLSFDLRPGKSGSPRVNNRLAPRERSA